MLSAYVVNSLSDDVNGGVADGHLTLREAVVALNTGRAFGDAAAPQAGIDPAIVVDPSLAGGTIDLTGTLVIRTDVAIDGGGVRLDANGAFRAVTITTADAVSISDLTILDGNAGDKIGGGLRIAGTDVRLTDVDILGNNAETGAGLAITGGSTVRIIDGDVSDNAADDLGGGAFVRDARLIVLGDTIFGDNIAGDDPNSPLNGGGAIAVDDGLLNVNGATFAGNIARGTSGLGGAVWIGSGTAFRIANSSFVANATDAVGDFQGNGGAFAQLGGSRGRIIDSVFDSNSASNGGAIATLGTLSISGSQLLRNTAAASGGGLWANSASLTATDTVFAGNDADNGGGLALVSSNAILSLLTVGQFELSDGTVVGGNFARFDGGGIFVGGSGTRTVLSDSLVEGNVATFAGGGFDYVAESGTIRIDRGSVFNGNSAESGGGISIRPLDGGPTAMTIYRLVDTTISNNVAGVNGGGVYFLNTTGLKVLKGAFIGTTVTGNSAGLNGGGVLVDGWFYTRDSLYRGNAAGTFGGGLFTAAGAFTDVFDSIVDENLARVGGPDAGPSGGGLYVEAGADSRTINSIFDDNFRVSFSGTEDNIVFA